MLILGVVAPDALDPEAHDLQITRTHYSGLPEELRRHLACTLVDKLEPIHQRHNIELLMMGEA